MRGGGVRCSRLQWRFSFRERERDFSLNFRQIRPSEFFGARRKVVLRGEDNAWTPVLRSFDKLREVGVSSYLSFTLCLSVFMMFELIEAVSGRLIGPKSWNRIVVIFEAQIVQSVTVHSWSGLLDCALSNKSCVSLYEAGNCREIRVHKVNR